MASNIQETPLMPDGFYVPAQTEHPLVQEGVLIPDWLQFDTTVVDVQPYAEPEEIAEGTFSFLQYTMSDGTAYHVMEGQPREQHSSIPVDGTTAWTTQPEGHNALTDQKLMELGFWTRRISAEFFPDIHIFSPQSVVQAIRKGWNVSLGYSAHNMNEILEVSDELHSGQIEPGVSFTAGESRDPMIEPGFTFLGRHRRKPRYVVHADSVDPCVAEDVRGFSPVRLVKVVAAEAEAMTRTAIHVLRSPDRKEYIRTIDFSLASGIPALLLANALLSGQAGELARIRPKESPMHLSFMRRSHGNDRKVYEEIYEDHPRVHIVKRNGAHIDIPRTRRGVVRRHGLIIEQLQANGDDPTAVDFDQVYELPSRQAGRGLLRLVVNNN